ncbi:MAG: hypothetical protein AMXMBFR58_09010 [Phycisphaerae bacterium]|nr:hypothetical protein [Phycisphaerales bacterium]
MITRALGLVPLIAMLAGCSSSPTVIVDNQTGSWFVGVVQIPTVSSDKSPSGDTRNELVIDSRGPERFRAKDRGFGPVAHYSQDVTVGVRLEDMSWWLVSIPWNGEPEVLVAIRQAQDGRYEAATNVDAPMAARYVRPDEIDAELGKPQ